MSEVEASNVIPFQTCAQAKQVQKRGQQLSRQTFLPRAAMTISLAAILFVAACFRLPYLSSIPGALSVDEASNGYDAYSILHTGRCRFGEFLPLFLRAFDDYREALYVYAAVPSVALFGLNEFSTRLPAALIGLATILAIFWLARELFDDDRIALVAALLLALCPWHIQFSRIAFRAILLPLLFSIGLAGFLRGRRQPAYFILSAIAFSLALCSYSSARVFVPLYLAALAFFFRQDLQRFKTWTLISGALFASVFCALALFWLSPHGMARARALADANATAIGYGYNYMTYFNPITLFWRRPPHPFFGPPRLGALNLFEVVTISMGLFGLLVHWTQTHSKVLLTWLILYPFPAALVGSYEPVKAILGAPLFAIVSAYGLFLIPRFVKENWKRCCWAVSILVVALSAAFVAKRYYVDYAQMSTRYWAYGMREAVHFTVQSDYDQILVSDKFFIPHISVLFFAQYDPAEYQRAPLLSIKQNEWYYTDFRFGKYHIVSLDKLRGANRKTLLMLAPQELKKIDAAGYAWREVHAVKDRQNKVVIKLVEVAASPRSVQQEHK